jgi:hypothetical protein
MTGLLGIFRLRDPVFGFTSWEVEWPCFVWAIAVLINAVLPANAARVFTINSRRVNILLLLEFYIHIFLEIVLGSGYFFHDKMPGYCLPGLTAATTLHFTACHIQHPLPQKPTASFAYPGGSSQLLFKSAGAIILP